MKISSLICGYLPTSDHISMFRTAFLSLVMQSRKPDQIVIVLDEPGDGIENKVRKFVDDYGIGFHANTDLYIPVELHVRPRKEGLAAAKNFGLRFCTGDYVTYCDADDSWMQCKLEVQEKYAQEHPDVDVIGTLAWDRESDGVMRPNCFAPGQYQQHAQIVRRLQAENVMCHGSVMVKKEKLDQLEGPYQHVLGAEDYDLWRRMIGIGCVFNNIPERLYVYSLGTGVER